MKRIDVVAGVIYNESQKEILIALRPADKHQGNLCQHRYPDKHVALDIWEVTRFDGEPVGQEHQAIRWVAIAELWDYEFPAANVAIVEKLTG